MLPRGLCARRHYSASAIGLSLCLFGLEGFTIGQTRQRVCTWKSFEPEHWTTLPRWLDAIAEGRLFPGVVRPAPLTFSGRKRAERAAATLCELGVTDGSLEERVFQGAALAA